MIDDSIGGHLLISSLERSGKDVSVAIAFTTWSCLVVEGDGCKKRKVWTRGINRRHLRHRSCDHQWNHLPIFMILGFAQWNEEDAY